MQRLIIIRGNSGSGKSTIAAKLRREMGYGTMLIPQDTIRREIIRVADDIDNPSIQLIEDIALYGKSTSYDVIVEGILAKEKYGKMLERLSSNFDQTFAFYFDVSFKETLRRHQYKLDKKNEFGEKEMREWWIDHDTLNLPNEIVLSENLSEDEALRFILDKISIVSNK